MNKQTKIPTLAGIFLACIGIAMFALLFEYASYRLGHASRSINPQDIQITNVTDNSFSVSWLTAQPSIGKLKIYDEHEKTQILCDERDSKNKIGKYTTHSVMVQNLEEDSEYQITIKSNRKWFSRNASLSVRTALSIPSAKEGYEPAYGTIVLDTNQPVSGALVYLTLDGGQKLSALSKTSGSWIIPLNFVRTQNHTQYLESIERRTETLQVYYDKQESNAITDTLNDSPVPTIVLGKTYDFRKQQAYNANNTRALQKNILGSYTEKTGQESFTVSILSPKQRDVLSTFLPLIQGTGVPGKLVTITIGITHPKSGTTFVGPDGMWRFTPTEYLSSGKQSVTATTRDISNNIVALTNTFEILKSGTQVLGEATPSATLAPSPTTSSTSTQATPSPSPSIVSSPTGTPLPITTHTSQPPTSGTMFPTLILLAFGLSMIIMGFVLLIPNRLS